jgi:hypothetical protein
MENIKQNNTRLQDKIKLIIPRGTLNASQPHSMTKMTLTIARVQRFRVQSLTYQILAIQVFAVERTF